MNQAKNQVNKLSEKIKSSTLPEELEQRILNRLDQLSNLTDSPTFLPEFDRINKYIDWVTDLPWNKRTDDVLEVGYAKEVLDKNHYGLQPIKERIMEYISVMKLKKEKGEGEEITRAPVLCFVGLVGTGKTTIAISIAEALKRKYYRIPFGGMGDPFDLRGQSRMHPEAEPGKIIKGLREVQSKNPVILLDEIDRVTDEGRASIMGVLVELLDPKQNQKFVDHYIDYPFDLSEVLFVATANNTRNIATAVMDRLEPISMPSYSDEEKITIGKDYMLPKILKENGISREKVQIKEEVWPNVVRPLGYDAGIRTLERTIESIARKVAKEIVENDKDQFVLTMDNIKEYMPR